MQGRVEAEKAAAEAAQQAAKEAERQHQILSDKVRDLLPCQCLCHQLYH